VAVSCAAKLRQEHFLVDLYHFNFIVTAVTAPHTQLKNKTNAGVNNPNSRPAIPLFAFIGKTTNNWIAVGNKLKIAPLKRILDFNIGRKNMSPQSPPQTMRG
jgi:hypothetical protein